MLSQITTSLRVRYSVETPVSLPGKGLVTLPTKYGTVQRPSGIKRMGHLVGLKIIARAVKARVELAQSDDILMLEKV